jgi:hypothetical protein
MNRKVFESSHSLIYSTIPAFAWRGKGKSQQPVRIAGVPIDIQTEWHSHFKFQWEPVQFKIILRKILNGEPLTLQLWLGIIKSVH